MLEPTADSCQILLDGNGGRASGCRATDPQTVHKVAQEFEALLIGQILKSAKFNVTGTSSAPDGDALTDYAEESLARQLSQQGGLGLAPLIESGLKKSQGQAANPKGSTAADSP
jgi:Rod binding domain-containing protein